MNLESINGDKTNKIEKSRFKFTNFFTTKYKIEFNH